MDGQSTESPVVAADLLVVGAQPYPVAADRHDDRDGLARREDGAPRDRLAFADGHVIDEFEAGQITPLRPAVEDRLTLRPLRDEPSQTKLSIVSVGRF